MFRGYLGSQGPSDQPVFLSDPEPTVVHNVNYDILVNCISATKLHNILKKTIITLYEYL
jgi:hypothetical protein